MSEISNSVFLNFMRSIGKSDLYLRKTIGKIDASGKFDKVEYSQEVVEDEKGNVHFAIVVFMDPKEIIYEDYYRLSFDFSFSCFKASYELSCMVGWNSDQVNADITNFEETFTNEFDLVKAIELYLPELCMIFDKVVENFIDDSILTKRADDWNSANILPGYERDLKNWFTIDKNRS